MKNYPRNFLLGAALAVSLTGTLLVFAQETPPAPPATEQKAPVTTAPDQAPAAVTPPAEPAPVPPAPAAPAATPAPVAPETKPAEAKPAESTPAAETVTPAPEEPKLRRLDEPTTPTPPDSKKPAKGHGKIKVKHRPSTGNEVVHFGSDANLAKDQTADAVVSIFGNSTSEGVVTDSVVAVLGNSRVTGSVDGSVVAVLGNAYVNSKVGDGIVAVLGNVELGPDAEVNNQVVAIGGRVIRDPKAAVHGEVQNVSFGGVFTELTWLHAWLTKCALYGRLLAFGPNLMWAWWIALGFLAFYVVLALLFGRGIEKCAETLEQRPGYSILSALLTVLLGPVVVILLAITGVGLLVVPFIGVALFVAGLFGKAVMLAWLGRRVTNLIGIQSAALAVLVGGVIVLLLYTVPVLGLVIYKLFGWIGLGVVVYTIILATKREKAAPPPPAPGAIPPVTPGGDPAAAGLMPLAVAPVPPAVASAASLPRAGFWIRIAALLLDLILIGILFALVHASGKLLLLTLAAYGAGMWRLRGSTIGGIVCGLKVVRLDDREVDWATAIVRALACFLSFVVLGFGFIWVVFDDGRQSWHDKIAGTAVVHVPKGVSLL
ncbi:MAG: RDD family protein [Verrucomicrobia bacterium]|nr:RDD family protein [Verrucomicrobiota bacterium]